MSAKAGEIRIVRAAVGDYQSASGAVIIDFTLSGIAPAAWNGYFSSAYGGLDSQHERIEGHRLLLAVPKEQAANEAHLAQFGDKVKQAVVAANAAYRQHEEEKRQAKEQERTEQERKASAVARINDALKKQFPQS